MLSNAEKIAVEPVVTREGIESFIDQVRALTIKKQRDAVFTALSTAISVTVTDWPAVTAAVSQLTAAPLMAVLADIKSEANAQRDDLLGPLFVELYAALAKHYGA